MLRRKSERQSRCEILGGVKPPGIFENVSPSYSLPPSLLFISCSPSPVLRKPRGRLKKQRTRTYTYIRQSVESHTHRVRRSGRLFSPPDLPGRSANWSSQVGDRVLLAWPSPAEWRRKRPSLAITQIALLRVMAFKKNRQRQIKRRGNNECVEGEKKWEMRLSTIGLRRAVNVRYEIYSRDAELSSVASISAAISYLSLPLRLRALGLPLLTRPTVLSLNRVCSTCSKVIGFAIREKKKKIYDIRPLLRSRDSFF